VDDEGATAFCERIRARLVGSLTVYCGEWGVAEELAQDALVRAWERWDKVSAMAAPEAWTYRTAFNLASSWGRRRAAERRAHDRAADERPVDQPDTATNHAVRDAVAELAPRQRAVIACRYFLGLTVAETAEVLGMAAGTVKATTHQALGVLRTSGLDDESDVRPQEVAR
jgi:RNA polymerase sigma-70 factor (ECF subfamily)